MKIHDVFHACLLKPYYEGGYYQPQPVTVLLNGEEELIWSCNSP